LVQQDSDPPPAEERVLLFFVLCHEFVAADIERSDDDILRAHGRGHDVVVFELKIFTRKYMPPDQQGFGPVETDAPCSLSFGEVELIDEFDIRREFHEMTVQRLRGKVAQYLQAMFERRMVLLPPFVHFLRCGSRVEDHTPFITVHDQFCLVGEMREELMHADDGRNLQRPCQ